MVTGSRQRRRPGLAYTFAMTTPIVPPAGAASPDWLQRLHDHAGGLGLAAWALFYALNAAAQTTLVGMEFERLGRPLPGWQIASWEWSSSLLLFALVPLVAWAEQRWPLQWGQLRRHGLIHLGLSVPYSVLHVFGMVAVRELVYAWHGDDYDFGPWPRELFYEYLKDWRSYLSVLLVVHFSRLLLRRSQGEASLLTTPDDQPAPEPAARPERFLVRKLGREFLIAADDIEYAVAAGNYVNLHVRQRDYPLRSTISGLAEQLDPARFQRVHRSVIIQLDQLAQIEPLESGDARLHMHNGQQLPCSRRYRAALRERGEVPGVDSARAQG